MRAKQLVKRAMQARSMPSMRQFAASLGVSHTIVSRWISGERTPGFGYAVELAKAAGLPPVETAAEIRRDTLDGKKLWSMFGRGVDDCAFEEE